MINTSKWKTEKSKIDSSVNFSRKSGDGLIECRFVQREPKYFTCYLSSHNGCNKGCKFCHLTQTGQTTFDPLSIHDIYRQARRVLRYWDFFHYDGECKHVNYAFMARGELLCNPNIDESFFINLWDIANNHHLTSDVSISTIMPKELENKKIFERFAFIQPTIYYSLYSLNPMFRKKWMPNALDANKAMRILKDYQERSNKIIKLHCALIRGENDYLTTWTQICKLIKKLSLIVDINIVKYNSYNDRVGRESIYYQGIEKIIENELGISPKIKNRVGFDVNASCGMFNQC